MQMRIIWGKILPGQWDAFEAAFKKGSIREGDVYTPGGGGTSALPIASDGTIYGQDDKTGQWFVLNDGTYWTTSPPPPGVTASTAALPASTALVALFGYGDAHPYPRGVITFATNGRMTAILTTAERSTPASDTDFKAVVMGMCAYAGRFTIEANHVVIEPDVAWLPYARQATDRPRGPGPEHNRLGARGMKLTPENQDNMDGRPPRKSTIQGDDAALQVVYQAAKARSTSESR